MAVVSEINCFGSRRRVRWWGVDVEIAGVHEDGRAGAVNVLCEVCGDVGWEDLLLHCNKCKNATRHHGIMKIGGDYIPVSVHLSNKACKKASLLHFKRLTPKLFGFIVAQKAQSEEPIQETEKEDMVY
ncbi:hypothetical protein E2562_000537 [Oryza meyeriana var. granulata]|uniref:Uncharacterized protein n=1 Tax=Oryza meyeriana var. granulata TaxID=110450 RepID=A0A6G1DUL1_9ORYZ|nr:hypothetical protein E2562_000537 [Oryza meyeriana var. granulata]